MNLHRIVAPTLLLLALWIAPLSAAETEAVSSAPATVTPAAEPLPSLTPDMETRAALKCVLYFCPVYYPEYYCTCEWVLCADGQYACGVPRDSASSGASLASCGTATQKNVLSR